MRMFLSLLVSCLLLFACPRPVCVGVNCPVPDAGSGGLAATGGQSPVTTGGGSSTGGQAGTGGQSVAWIDCAPEGTFRAGPIVKHKLGARMVAPPIGMRLEAPVGLTPRSGIWDALNPIPLDQGNVGRCVGYSAAECLSTRPFGLPSTAARGDSLYHEATVLDSFVGTWPPDDTGSDCISGARAAQKLGLIVGFDIAYTLADIKGRLTLGPGIFCSNWSTLQFSPDRCGQIHYDPSSIEGGHARAMVGQSVERGLIVERNTWGKWATTYRGNSGYFSESYDDIQRMLNDGGVAVFYRVP